MIGTIAGVSGHHLWIETAVIPPFRVGDRLDLDKHKEKRSLNANSYFHVLVGELATVLRLSKSYVKNMLVANYGQVYIYKDKIATYTTTIPPEIVLNQEEPHLWLIDTNILDGETWYSYRVYRKTSEYDTREFSILLDGTIEECRQQDIETMTPNELLRLAGYEKQSYN